MHRPSLSLLLAGAVFAGGWFVTASAQGTSTATPPSGSQDTSVADAARKARADKKSEPPSAKHVWNDDNIPKDPREIPAPAATEGGSPPEQLGQGATSPLGAQAAAKGAAAAQGLSEDEKAKKDKQLEAEWRSRFATAQKKLDDDTKEADLMQREYNLKRQQYYSDPNQALREQYAYPSGRGGELNDLAKKIDEKKAQIEQDKQAISDLEDQLRKEGLPAGWARP